MNLYYLKSLEPSDPPDTHTPQKNQLRDKWYRYEITGTAYNVVGWRQGKKEDVKAAVEKLLEKMNSRTRGKYSNALRLANSSPRNIPVGRGLSRSFSRKL